MPSTRTVAATATAAGLAVLGGAAALTVLSGPAQAAPVEVPAHTSVVSRSWAAPAPSIEETKGSTWAGHTATPVAKWWGHGKAPASITLASYSGRKFGPESITLA